VDLPLDVHAHAHMLRDVIVMAGVFALALWVLFRFASR
jgi:hypothetical protein